MNERSMEMYLWMLRYTYGPEDEVTKIARDSMDALRVTLSPKEMQYLTYIINQVACSSDPDAAYKKYIQERY